MKLKGKAWKYGDNINTDVIFPGKYTYTVNDPEEAAAHAFEDVDPGFSKKISAGDILIVGKNFGCGSSREQAVTALKFAGITAVVGKSFARIYFRNAVNNGLILVESNDAVDEIQEGEEVEIDTETGTITARDKVYTFPPLPQFVLDIMDTGGLIPYTRKKLGLE